MCEASVLGQPLVLDPVARIKVRQAFKWQGLGTGSFPAPNVSERKTSFCPSFLVRRGYDTAPAPREDVHFLTDDLQGPFRRPKNPHPSLFAQPVFGRCDFERTGHANRGILGRHRRPVLNEQRPAGMSATGQAAEVVSSNPRPRPRRQRSSGRQAQESHSPLSWAASGEPSRAPSVRACAAAHLQQMPDKARRAEPSRAPFCFPEQPSRGQCDIRPSSPPPPASH